MSGRNLTRKEQNRFVRAALEQNVSDGDLCTLDDLADDLFGFQVIHPVAIQYVARKLRRARNRLSNA
jgi:hypothetical protein